MLRKQYGNILAYLDEEEESDYSTSDELKELTTYHERQLALYKQQRLPMLGQGIHHIEPAN